MLSSPDVVSSLECLVRPGGIVLSLPCSNVQDFHAVLNVATNAKMIVWLNICGPVCFQTA